MTRDELRERIVARIAELDESHEFVEPYEGAGYCVCDDCQKERPLLRDMLALLAAQETPTDDWYRVRSLADVLAVAPEEAKLEALIDARIRQAGGGDAPE